MNKPHSSGHLIDRKTSLFVPSPPTPRTSFPRTRESQGQCKRGTNANSPDENRSASRSKLIGHLEQVWREATHAVERSPLYGGTYRKGNGRCLKTSVAKKISKKNNSKHCLRVNRAIFKVVVEVAVQVGQPETRYTSVGVWAACPAPRRAKIYRGPHAARPIFEGSSDWVTATPNLLEKLGR